MNQKSDIQLIELYLRGDQESLELLLKRYLGLIYNVAFSYLKNEEEAQDVAQEVSIKIWKKLPQYCPRFSFQAWVWQITKNCCKDHLKKKKGIPFSAWENSEGENVFFELLTDGRPLADELIATSQQYGRIEDVISTLPRISQKLLQLYYNKQLNFREIAVLTDQPLNTVKSRHRRALIALRKKLRD